MNALERLTIVALLSIVTMPSFAGEQKITGTYGTSPRDPAAVSLTLNENHSFSYRDLSNPSKKIDITGTWKQKGKAIVLSSPASKYAFHRKWKISGDGQSAKSRKGFTYYRLCKN